MKWQAVEAALRRAVEAAGPPVDDVGDVLSRVRRRLHLLLLAMVACHLVSAVLALVLVDPPLSIGVAVLQIGLMVVDIPLVYCVVGSVVQDRVQALLGLVADMKPSRWTLRASGLGVILSMILGEAVVEVRGSLVTCAHAPDPRRPCRLPVAPTYTATLIVVAGVAACIILLLALGRQGVLPAVLSLAVAVPASLVYLRWAGRLARGLVCLATPDSVKPLAAAGARLLASLASTPSQSQLREAVAKCLNAITTPVDTV